MSSPSPLKQLSNFISDNVDVVDDRCKALGHEYPSLHEPFNPFNPAEALTRDPVVVQNIIVIVAAADQLITTARLPINTTADLAFSFHTYSALQAVTTANIPEILREVGPHGTQSKDIATKTYLDTDKIFRFLRLLVTQHVFRELEPDVWTSNRPSSMLDTGKSVEELSAKPDAKHDGTHGIAALVEHSIDKVLKGSALMVRFCEIPSRKDRMIWSTHH
ncbi:hypothetical protein M422DRAFT_244262 [Sphaerobolus stellatus SS14]|nr:hypothetical protein M422DRAFT_244262 [Sphaerobolus stellatus SS14]